MEQLISYQKLSISNNQLLVTAFSTNNYIHKVLKVTCMKMHNQLKHLPINNFMNKLHNFGINSWKGEESYHPKLFIQNLYFHVAA